MDTVQREEALAVVYLAVAIVLLCALMVAMIAQPEAQPRPPRVKARWWRRAQERRHDAAVRR